MTEQQLKDLPTMPPPDGGKYRVDICGELQPHSCQVWEHRVMPSGKIESFFVSKHPPVLLAKQKIKLL